MATENLFYGPIKKLGQDIMNVMSVLIISVLLRSYFEHFNVEVMRKKC